MRPLTFPACSILTIACAMAGCSGTSKLGDSGTPTADVGDAAVSDSDGDAFDDLGVPADMGGVADLGADAGEDGGAGLDGGLEPDAGTGGWPAELRADAERLFITPPNSILNQNNWSGAHYNPVTSQLWLVRDFAEIRVYDAAGDGFIFNARYPIAADFEGITQADTSNASEVYVLVESETELRRYDFAASATASTTWNLTSLLGMAGDLEGLAFVPDVHLASSGFVDGAGITFSASRGGYGGLMLISHQRGGDVFAIDLAPNGTFALIGRYACPLSKTRGLELDRDTGLLYMVDGDGSARVRLSSTGGVFDLVDMWPEPGPDGAEGIALTPRSASRQWIIITDDDNLGGDAAVLRYRDFRP